MTLHAARRFASQFLLASIVAVRASAQEQSKPRLEFGVDQAFLLDHQNADNSFRSSYTIRWGWISRTRLMAETRMGITDLRTVGGVNFMWHFASTGEESRYATYLTVGATVGLGKIVDSDRKETAAGFNIGVGRRFRWGPHAVRPEVTVAHVPAIGSRRSGTLVNARSQFGVRFGVSAFR